MEVSKVMGVPPSDHPFDVGIFHETDHPAIKGYPHDYGTPHIYPYLTIQRGLSMDSS